MVMRVRLEGLNVVCAKGRWYVYRRSTGEALVKGFDGSRADLEKKLAEPALIQTYNRPRVVRKPASDYGIETLGGFIHWFTNGDIDRTVEQRKAVDRFGDKPDGYPKWSKLSDATHKDYLAAYEYLRPECLSENKLNPVSHL
jgi:hypothetical protein